MKHMYIIVMLLLGCIAEAAPSNACSGRPAADVGCSEGSYGVVCSGPEPVVLDTFDVACEARGPSGEASYPHAYCCRKKR